MLPVELLVFWLICAGVGAFVGAAKQSPAAGFFLGLLLGPLGVLAAFALDGRRQCPRCHGRISGFPELCQHCGHVLPQPRDQAFDINAGATNAEDRELQRKELEAVQRMRERRRTNPPH